MHDELDIPSGPLEAQQALELLADREPIRMAEWVQRHPKNFMLYMGWEVLPFHESALNDFLNHQRTFWLAPRGAGKTNAFLCGSAWLAISDPDIYTKAGVPYLFPDAPREIGPHNIRVALTGNSADNAALGLYQIKHMLTSERMLKLFGDLEGPRWKDQRADTCLRQTHLRESTFTALGLGSRITGGHYDAVLCDDWVTEENARTDLQRKRLENFWKLTVKPAHEPWSRTFGAGTRYHPMDWYGSCIYQWVKAGVWDNLRRTPALFTLNGEERSYWPGSYSLDILHAIREEVGEIAFSTQYQNVVDVMLGDFFEHTWLEQFCKWDELKPEERKKARTIITLDPAIKAGLRNDYSVFCILSVIGKRAYVRRIVRGQWTEDELKYRSRLLCNLYKPDLMGVEVVGGLEWLVDSLRKMDGLPYVRKLRPQQYKGKDKVGRASHVRKWFEQLRVYLEEPDKANGIQRLIHECMAFPNACSTPGMDDCVDAMVWALILAGRGRGRLGRQSA